MTEKDDDGRGFRPLVESLYNHERWEAEATRVWVVFDWDEQGWQNFVSDPELPAIMKEAGHKMKPQAAKFAAKHSS